MTTRLQMCQCIQQHTPDITRLLNERNGITCAQCFSRPETAILLIQCTNGLDVLGIFCNFPGNKHTMAWDSERVPMGTRTILMIKTSVTSTIRALENGMKHASANPLNWVYCDHGSSSKSSTDHRIGEGTIVGEGLGKVMSRSISATASTPDIPANPSATRL
jgi:hypothetical protein